MLRQKVKRREILMVHIVGFAEIGALVGDPARANMLEALMDRRALTAKELASRAGISPQTASGHLFKMLTAGLITMEQHGRHHYHSLASAEIARMLEGMQQVASTQNIKYTGRTIRTGPRDAAMRVARGCYDHMAGHLAVGITEAMLGRGQIEFEGDGGSVTDAGRLFLEKFGIDIAAATQTKRVFCRPCLDWSERRYHLAGVVGAALLHRTMELKWLKRQDSSRALTITRAGQEGFRKTFGIEPVTLDPPILGHIPRLANQV
jgi:DNA-binding transcriptional ArsR family regulator